MKIWNILILLALVSFSAFGENFAVKPLTAEELNSRQLVKGEKRTFEVKVYEKDKVFFTGLIKPTSRRGVELEKKFEAKDGPFKAALDLRTLAELQSIFDQGNCGSCVYNAVDACWNDTMRLRGMVLPLLSRQYLMSCGSRDSMCNGSWFEIVAGDLVKMGGLPLESEYPYTASNASCKGKSFDLKGKVVSDKLISTTDKSIIGALNEYYPVATTIGAGGPFMNYSGGVMNQCSNVGTNHQMVIEGYRCVGSSVDAQGNCVFDSQGNVKAGDLEYLVRNSWGMWGDKGWIWMKARDSRGNRCNNLAEEVGIIEVGINPKPPTPPTPPAPPTPPVPPPVPGGDSDLWKYIVAGAAVLIAFLGGCWFLKKK